ncbi:hypothetical protein R1flu_013611 [Riccia fluitans]|uniref:Myb-like domain-containing protein n=1 Tax=Riccia fluitans TaxID=41844 RepID=A0ABD1YE17_9MARC
MEDRRSSFELFRGNVGSQAMIEDSQPAYYSNQLSQPMNLSQYQILVMPSIPQLFPFLRPTASILIAQMTSLIASTPVAIPFSTTMISIPTHVNSMPASSVVPTRPIPNSRGRQCPNNTSMERGPESPNAKDNDQLDGDISRGGPAVIMRGHMVWADWMVVALLECKRLEYDEAENAIGREAIINSDLKWRRIQSLMREKGVNADTTQLRNKWKSTIGCYKKVRN